MSANPLKDLNADRPTEIVEIGKKKITVVGLSGGDLGRLVTRFPEIARAITGGTVDPGEIIQAVPQAIPAIIAAGFRKMGDEEIEADAAELSLDDMASFLEKILIATMPGGADPFVKRLHKIAAGLGVKGVPEPSSTR